MSGESANVDILINAFTQAAQEALDEVGDEMNDLTADGAAVQAAMDEVADEMDDATTSSEATGESMDDTAGSAGRLAGILQILQGRADEAADELDDAGQSAATTGGLFGALTAGTQGLNLSFGLLSTQLTAALIPALGALLAALVPLAAVIGTVATAAVGLAGAFGAVIGTGILAFGDQLADQNQERLDQINAEIRQLRELKRQRGELSSADRQRLRQAEAVIDSLEVQRKLTGSLTDEQQRRLQAAQATIDEIERQGGAEGALTDQEKQRLETLKEKREALKEQTSATGALAGVVQDLKAELAPLVIEFGQQFIPLIRDGIDAIPELVRRTLDAIGGMDEFKNALRDAGSAAMTAIPQLAAALFDFAREALPMLVRFGTWLLNNGGDIFQGMLETTRRLGPTLMSLIDSFIQALPAINRIGIVVLETVVPALDTFFQIIKRLDNQGLSGLKSTLGTTDRGMRALRAGIQSLRKGVKAIRPLFNAFIDDFQEHGIPAIGAIINIIGKLAQAFGSLPLAAQKAALAALLVGISALLGPIAGLIAIIGAAALTFQLLEDAYDVAINAGSRFAASLQETVIDWVNEAIVTLNDYLRTLDRVADAVENATGVDLPEFEPLDTLEGGSEPPPDPRTTATGRRRGTGQGPGDQGVTLDVQGDNPLADFIRDQVEANADQQDREDVRRQRRAGTGL